MKRNIKLMLAAFSAAALAGGMLGGCSGTADTTNTANTSVTADISGTVGDGRETTAVSSKGGNISISILNSKGEIQAALEDMASDFEKESGIRLDVIACGAGESPYTRITSMYNSGTAPTLAILDTTDVIALADEDALDLSDSSWLKDCEAQVTKINGKVYSFPFCIEGRGIIYNKKAIETALGKEFDPSSIHSLDSFLQICEDLRASGMENPVVLSKEDWSLGAHQLGYIYDAYDGTTAGSEKIIDALKNGTQKVEDYNVYNQFMDTLDVLMKYNVNRESPLGAIYEEDPIYLADGKAAFWPNGSWAWPNLVDAGAKAEDGYGFIPFILGNDTKAFANNEIQAAPSKQVMIDRVQSSKGQQEAAKQFLDWIVNSETGQKDLVEKCAIIPACKNNPVIPSDPLGQDIVKKMNDGQTYSSSFVAPGDAWSVCGALIQKYIAGEADRTQTAQGIDAYWAAQK